MMFNDIRGSLWPTSSWHLCYGWGKPPENPTRKTWPGRGSNPGPLGERQWCYPSAIAVVMDFYFIIITQHRKGCLEKKRTCVCIGLYVCECLSQSVSVQLSVWSYLCLCLSLRIYLRVCLRVSLCVSMCLYLPLCKFVSVFLYVCVCRCVCVCISVCVYCCLCWCVSLQVEVCVCICMCLLCLYISKSCLCGLFCVYVLPCYFVFHLNGLIKSNIFY